MADVDGTKVVALLARGRSIKQAAAALGVTRWQVDDVLRDLRREYRCSTNYQLMWAVGVNMKEDALAMQPRRRASYMREYHRRHKGTNGHVPTQPAQ